MAHRTLANLGEGDDRFFLIASVSHLRHLPAPAPPSEDSAPSEATVKAIRLRDEMWEKFKRENEEKPQSLDNLSTRLTKTAKDLEAYERKVFYLRVQQILPDEEEFHALIHEQVDGAASELLRVNGLIRIAEDRCRLAGGGNDIPTTRHMRPWQEEEHSLITLEAAQTRATHRKTELQHLVRVIEWEEKKRERAKANGGATLQPGHSPARSRSIVSQEEYETDGRKKEYEVDARNKHPRIAPVLANQHHLRVPSVWLHNPFEPEDSSHGSTPRPPTRLSHPSDPSPASAASRRSHSITSIPRPTSSSGSSIASTTSNSKKSRIFGRLFKRSDSAQD